MVLNTWGGALRTSFDNLWLGVASVVPHLVIAIIIVILGWLVGALLGRAVWHVFKSLRVDEALRRAGFESFLRRGGLNLDSGAFFGGLVKWFVIIVFLVAAFGVLGLNEVNDFLKSVVLAYIPDVIVAALVLVVAGVVGDVVDRLVVAAAKTADVRTAHLAGAVARWAVWIVAILVALDKLGVTENFADSLFNGIVVALSLAIGLAFGLGGQEAAARLIERARSDMSGKHHQ